MFKFSDTPENGESMRLIGPDGSSIDCFVHTTRYQYHQWKASISTQDDVPESWGLESFSPYSESRSDYDRKWVAYAEFTAESPDGDSFRVSMRRMLSIECTTNRFDQAPSFEKLAKEDHR